VNNLIQDLSDSIYTLTIPLVFDFVFDFVFAYHEYCVVYCIAYCIMAIAEPIWAQSSSRCSSTLLLKRLASSMTIFILFEVSVSTLFWEDSFLVCLSMRLKLNFSLVPMPMMERPYCTKSPSVALGGMVKVSRTRTRVPNLLSLSVT